MYIGIDLGTSSVKLLLTSKLGKVIKTVSRKYPLIFPFESWSEQNPNEWYEKTIDGLQELVKGFENEIKGISFSGQMHGMVLLDESDSVIRNAILWNDQRTTKEVDYLNDVIGKDNLMKYTGNIALTGLTIPKVLWVKANEPENFKRIAKVMLPKDYLIYKLTGLFTSDVSDTSGTLYYDVKNKKYSKEMLEIMGLDESCFPNVIESYETVGLLKQEIKQLLDIKQDVNVIAGGGDQAVGAVGLGIVNNNQASISLGTSGVIFVAAEHFTPDNISHLQSYAHANGKYHIMGVMLSAAGAMEWFNSNIIGDEDYDQLFKEIEQIDAKQELYFLPYLMGERSPINDPFAKGAFIGLSMAHTKYDLARSIIEGVTFALKDTLELIRSLGINVENIRITGGGAKSDFWCQLIANIMNVTVTTITTDEGPALGAAILAMVGCGEYETVEKACDSIIKTNNTFVSNPILYEIYQQKYAKFTQIYPSVKHLFL